MQTRSFPGSRLKTIKDGDTVVFEYLDLGFSIKLENVTMRINGVDTPETRTRDKLMKFYGLFVRDQLKIHAPTGAEYEAFSDALDGDNFGRILGSFDLFNGENVATWLIENRYAVEWDDDKEVRINGHRKNLRYLVLNNHIYLPQRLEEDYLKMISEIKL